MKHTALFTFSLLLLTSSASVPLRWTVETSRAVPAQFAAYQGETLTFEAALQSDGKPLEAPINYSLYWQTNGMGSTYWSVPCTQPNSNTLNSNNSNTLYATWSPTNDVGAKVYNCFIGQPGTIYHAAFQLRLRPSPGATPNELPLPQKVIDFSKVTVLNPPWSGGGGGGGVDINAVRDIVREQLATNGIRAVDGAARTLPKYLHLLDFDNSYPDAAAEYYAKRGSGVPAASCSSVRSGSFLYRNFDYPFDDRAEFVVKMSSGTVPSASSPTGASTHRFASVGVSHVGTNLTEAIVASGKPSRWYKSIPGATVDGINENGVACNINVVDGDPQWGGGVSPALHPLAAVRWILDNATNAEHAATYIASHIAFPSGWTQNFHYMVCDKTSTYIVENGAANLVTGATGVPPVAVLTNFRLYPTRDTTGEGQERYDALVSGASITSQWWTLTYTAAGYRASDLPGITGETLTQLFNYWENNPRESHRGETFGTMTWWQTVHTSVYDLTNRVLRICVQENDDWYTFAVPGATGVSPVAVRDIVQPMIGAATNGIPEQIAALQDGKRDKFDESPYKRYNNWFVSNGERGYNPPINSQPWYSDVDGKWHWVWDDNYMESDSPREATHLEFYETGASGVFFTADFHVVFAYRDFSRYFIPVATADDVRPWDTDLVKYDSGNDRFVKAIPGTDYVKEHQDISGKRDRDDNTCHNTEFTEWTLGGGAAGMTDLSVERGDESPVVPGRYYYCLIKGSALVAMTVSASYDGYELHYEFESFNPEIFQSIPTATRTAVCTDGKKFTTSDVVDGKVSAAVSTNNPAFVSAVRNTPAPEPGQGEDPPWGTWGTLGAAIAGLVSGLAWVKNKIGVIFDNEGEIKDYFVTNLLGKSVANAKVRYALSTTASATMADRTVNIYTLSSGMVPMVFPTATTHDGTTYARDFLLKLTYSGGTLQMPTGVTKVGDELSFEAGKTYLIAFTEIAADKFYVRSIEITEAQA